MARSYNKGLTLCFFALLREPTGVAILSLTLAFFIGPVPTFAQVTTTITESGLNTSIEHAAGSTTWNIRGGTPSTGDSNLFHSFGDLSVRQGDTAAFQNLQADGTTPVVTNAGDVNNIIGRVTGGNPSNIYGTINTTEFSSANLFLINPAGIVFGPDAKLFVGGAMHFSTADYLRLGTGNELFFADLTKNSTLSSAPVSAFGFLGSNPTGTQAIEAQGNLVVLGNGSFSLVGRDIGSGPTAVPGITIDGGEIANRSGFINVVSVGTPLDPMNPDAGGEVSAIDFNPASPSSGHGFATLGGIRMSNNGSLNVSGISNDPLLNSVSVALGQLVIRGGQLTMEGGAQILAGTTDGSPQPAGIDINVTGAMTLSGEQTAIDTSNDGSAVIPGADVLIHAGSLNVTDGAQIITTNNSMHPDLPGGGITDVTADTITLSGAIGAGDAVSSGFLSGTGIDTAGDGRDIRVTTNRLEILDGATIDASTQGTGVAGTVQVSADHVVLSGGGTISSSTTSDGAGGTISVAGGTGLTGLVQLAGGSITAATTGSGQAGNISVSGNSVTVSGMGSSIDSTTTDAGNAGNIQVQGDLVNLQNGGTITTSSSSVGNAGTVQVSADRVQLSGGGEISSSTAGSGAGGTVSVAGAGPTGAVQLSGGSITAATTGSGNAGNISVSGNSVSLTGPDSTIDTSTTSTGNAGNILVQAGQVNIENGGIISSASIAPATGNAGSVTIITTDQFQSDGGKVTTSADNGAGGDITIQSDEILLNSVATIAASTTGPMDAGNILLVAGDRIMLQDSTVTTTALQASGGNITLLAPNLVRLKNGKIISSVQGGTGTSGGDITINDPQAVLLQDNSQILAQAFLGNGGNISITAGVLIVEPGSLIDATSQLGISGQVSVQAPIQNLAGLVTPLPQSFGSVGTLYGQHCAASKGGQFSSLVQGARDGVPPQPGDFLSSPMGDDLMMAPPSLSQPSANLKWSAIRLGLTDGLIHEKTSLAYVSSCRS